VDAALNDGTQSHLLISFLFSMLTHWQYFLNPRPHLLALDPDSTQDRASFEQIEQPPLPGICPIFL
jgi:hypothetical protein